MYASDNVFENAFNAFLDSATAPGLLSEPSIVTKNAAGGYDLTQAGFVAPGAIPNPFTTVANIAQNLGVFTIGIVLVIIGGLWLTFSWGEDIVSSLDSVMQKIPAVPIE